MHMPARGAIQPMCPKTCAVSAQRQHRHAQKQHVSHICAETQRSDAKILRSAAQKRNDAKIHAVFAQMPKTCAVSLYTHSQRAILRHMRKDIRTCMAHISAYSSYICAYLCV